MVDLTSRQAQILKALIEEYVNTAEPVGSLALEKKYNLGVSPATIRNEMATLVDLGMLRQPHTSAGRVPTPAALRFYVDHLMQEKKLSVAEEVSAKEEVWDVRDDYRKLLKQATAALAQRTKALSVAATDEGDMYYSGAANILDMPEFFDIDVARGVLSLLDEQVRLRQLFLGQESSRSADPIQIVFGADLGWPYFEPIGIAYARFVTGSHGFGTLGVIGPCRLNFPRVVPNLRYFSDLLSRIISDARY